MKVPEIPLLLLLMRCGHRLALTAREKSPLRPPLSKGRRGGFGRVGFWSVHKPEVEIGGTLANFSTVIGPFFDRFAEVEPNEDA